VEFGALMSSSAELMQSLLRPQVLWMDRKRPGDIAALAQAYDPFDSSPAYLEADISRCDKSFKSYGLIVLIDELLRVLRLHWLVRLNWYKSMDETRVRALEAGIRFILTDQIKSGFFVTWFGNTSAIQVAIANSVQLFDVRRSELPPRFDVDAWFKSPIDLDKPLPAVPVDLRYHYAMATGDDGLIAMVRPISSDAMVRLQEHMSKLFNLEVKVILSDVPYFASGYLLIDCANRLAHFIANPLKVIEKKSYYVNAANAQWRDYWQSMRDALAPLSSTIVRQLLADAVQGRMRRQLPNLRSAIDVLFAISQSQDMFKDLYESEIKFL